MQLDTSHKSPNHSSRFGYVPRLFLLHASVGGLQGSLSWLCNNASKVSSHYLISKTGLVYRLVDESEAAWHAGRANWQGETDVNAISIGVELENLTGMTGFKGQDPYPAVQVQALTDLARDCLTRYPDLAFARHLDVAIPKGRKSDPAGFDWTGWRSTFSSVSLPPNPARYRVKKIMISTRPEGGPPWAGELQPGDLIEIDQIYANDVAHLVSGLGFVRMADIEPWGK